MYEDNLVDLQWWCQGCTPENCSGCVSFSSKSELLDDIEHLFLRDKPTTVSVRVRSLSLDITRKLV